MFLLSLPGSDEQQLFKCIKIRRVMIMGFTFCGTIMADIKLWQTVKLQNTEELSFKPNNALYFL